MRFNSLLRGMVRALAVVALSAGVVVTNASPSLATAQNADFETDYAVAGSIPSIPEDQCAVFYDAKICFEKYGDKIWVKDINYNGEPAWAPWENELKANDGNWYHYRHGGCHTTLGYGRWGYCNKDFYEHGNYNAYEGWGSRIVLPGNLTVYNNA